MGNTGLASVKEFQNAVVYMDATRLYTTMQKAYTDKFVYYGTKQIILHATGQRPVFVQGPAIIIGDFLSEEKSDSIYCFDVIRQVAENLKKDQLQKALAERAAILVPNGLALRAFLNNLAVKGLYQFNNNNYKVKSVTLPTNWGNIEDSVPFTNVFTQKTRGGFVPIVPDGWVAVDCSNPAHPHPRTSWVIARADDKRLIYDKCYDF